MFLRTGISAVKSKLHRDRVYTQHEYANVIEGSATLRSSQSILTSTEYPLSSAQFFTQ